MFKKLSFIAALTLMAVTVSAQTFEVPVSITLEKKADFDYFNKDIVACVDWLMTTPFDAESEKRKRAGAFLIQWISGHPDITVSLTSAALTGSKKNPELLIIFMGGWAKYMIEHPEDIKNMNKGTLAGLRAIIQVYNGNLGAKKDKEVEKLAKLDQEGKLEQWVADNSEK